MAKLSVASAPLSSNDVLELANLFETGLQYYYKHCSPFEEDYIKNLSKIVGLGFTAILVDHSFVGIYEPYLKEFFSIRNFKIDRNNNRNLGVAIANIVTGSAYAFRFLKSPDYYLPFVEAVKKAITHMSVQESGKTERAEEIFKQLF